jgi:hypothetical protein
MNLPKTLAPWSEHLEIFPIELASALGPMVQRISAAVGPLRGKHLPGVGDPDGFHGIARRGPYERLLISEWLFAEEAPDEFARRAAMGEHGFLEIELKEPFVTRRSVALFDAGPDQLGWARIAHLAILIVLARRAEAVGARFQWGVLQSGSTLLQEGVGVAGVRKLLDARTPYEPLEEALMGWRGEIDFEGPAHDFWLVGGRRCAWLSEKTGLSLLQVGELIEPGQRRLVVAVCPNGRREKEIGLDMPDDRTSARLIRDPFQSATPTAARGPRAWGGGLIFTDSGNKILTRGVQETLLAFAVPNSPRAPASPPRSYRMIGSAIAAAGRVRKAIMGVSLSLDPDWPGLHLRCLGGKCGSLGNEAYRITEEGALANVRENARLGSCYLMPQAWQGDPQWMVEAGGVLFRLVYPQHHDVMPRAEVEAASVAAVGRTMTGIAYVARRTDAHILVSMGEDGQRRAHKGFKDLTGAAFGYGGTRAHGRFGLLAVGSLSEGWVVMHADGITMLPAPEGRVIGPLWNEPTMQGPALVVVEPDDRTITLVGQAWRQTVVKAQAPIAEAAVSHAAPQIAYKTAAGGLVVYSVAHQANVLDYQGHGE